MAAIYKKEVRSYFTSMIGCVFIAFALVIIGLYFFANNLYGGYPYFGYSLSATIAVFMILIPILTMKSMADDRRQKTDQMLLTAPVTTWQIIFAKYLAMVTVFLVPVCVMLFYPLIMAAYGTISYAMAYASIFGFALMGFLGIAVGMFISSLTESQVISAVLTFLILFASYMAESIADMIPSTAWVSMAAFIILILAVALIVHSMTQSTLLGGGVAVIGVAVILILYFMDSTSFQGAFGDLISSLSLTGHFYNFASGIIDIPGIIYYLSGSFLFIFLADQAVEKRRWC
ncbi:ABC-2 type transport system permease protein [Catenibacillus scindens]|uniref:ABC-2 type transport system permease protein n=1 Tax=Catenibacillus scindens TaxID=673271 RepID=A0A7W8H850_9FIRM|nr:ABC transporter permease [Catenibacillus scindens]MBB5263268.1 ABC-2 type transport system permease protein [Catenibacillus scindens]